jgi:hypothetical protein
MHEHDRRAVARNVIGNGGAVVSLQGPCPCWYCHARFTAV